MVMASDEIRTRLTHLAKPLRYAMRHNFARLAQLRDLERYMQHHLTALQGLSLPAALTSLLQQLTEAIQGVDTLTLAEKRTRLSLLDHLVSQMRDALSSPAETPQPPMEPSGEEPLTHPI